jgi:hypothetical protein
MASELTVSYDEDERLAQLTLTGPAKAWPPIRRVCQDASEQTEIVDDSSLKMPWWAFLGCREEVEYQAKRFDVVLKAEGLAIEKLAQAENVEAQYEAAIKAQPLAHDIVEARLAALKFKRAVEKKLTSEQSRNIAKLVSLPSGAAFSVPGAGKTTEVLAVYCLRRTNTSRLAVICPKNAFPAWEEQLALCLPKDEPFVRLRGGHRAIEALLKKEPGKVLLTYEQLPTVIDLIAAYVAAADSFLFLDESHRMKRGFSGVIGNCVLSLAERPKTKLIMSGTPMPNDIADLVPQFRFLFPEIAADDENVEGLIQPIYTRTTKTELNLPRIEHTIVRIPLRPAQFELYELLRSENARQMKAGLSVRDRMSLRRAGSSALRMLQLTTNPGLLARIEFEHPSLLSAVLEEGDSPKLEYACYRVRQLAAKGEKSIIWSSFVNNVDTLANRLIDIGAEFIHGKVDAGSEDEEGTREQKVKRFHEDPRCWVLVANPAACGEGISLHKVCHNAIYLDRNYNAAQYLQSEDRIHRLGLLPDQKTFVEILVAPDTIDESVGRRLALKIENMARVLRDNSLSVEPEILDLDADGFNLDDYNDLKQHLDRRV